MNQHAWDVRFVKLALDIAQWSKDPDTKVGAVIVGPDNEIRSTGYNGMCRGSNDDVESRYVKPGKYMYFEHAEKNAIYNAARIGVSLKGCTIYCESTATNDLCATSCIECCRAIIQSGVTRVVQRCIGKDFRALANTVGGWRADWETVLNLFDECGVIFTVINP